MCNLLVGRRVEISAPILLGSNDVAAEDVGVDFIAGFGWETEKRGGGLVLEGAWGKLPR